MVKHANQIRANQDAATWLSQMQNAHANLSKAINVLERLTRGPRPDEFVLDNIRWKVSKASLSRRLLWGRIHAHLSVLNDPQAQANLHHLQEVDIRLIRASSEHVGRWTTEAILRNWPAYCEASERMRSRMVDAITVEKRLLFPFLKALDEL